MSYEEGIRYKEQSPNLAVWEFLQEQRPELRENCLKELIEIAKRSSGLDNLKGKDYIDFCIEAVLEANISDNLKQKAIDYLVQGFYTNCPAKCYNAIKDLATQNDRALEALKTIANNNNPDYTFDLGLVYVGRNLHDNAIDCFMRICNLPTVHENAYARIRDYLESINDQFFTRIKKLADGCYEPAIKDLAGLYKDLKLYDDASNYYLILLRKYRNENKISGQKWAYNEIYNLAELQDIEHHSFENLKEVTNYNNSQQLYNLGKLYEANNHIDDAISIFSQLYSILHFNSKSTEEISKYTYDALVKYAKTGMSKAIKVLETISNKGDIPTTEILCEIYTDTDQSVKVLKDAFNYEDGDESSRTRILLHLKELANNGNVTAKNILNEVAQRNEIVAFLIE